MGFLEDFTLSEADLEIFQVFVPQLSYNLNFFVTIESKPGNISLLLD